jgi:hypothetical protein
MIRVRLFLVMLASLVAFAVFGTGAALAAGGIVFDGSVGTGPPPATLGGHTVRPFAPDSQPFGDVASVLGPSGDITFSPALDHVAIGNGWATWSNGYAGDVYWTDGGLSATVDLPSGTSAFYLYAEPDPFAVFDITATAEDGTTSSGTVSVDGDAGATFFGFYTTGGETIASITVSSAIDFAIGEFGINAGSYVALGDSYSSGEGNPPFLAGTDGGGDFCHRSPLAYSEVLGAEIGLNPLFYACSGAVTSNITSTFHFGEPPQITEPGVDSSASLVTMTIGGNDAGFSNVLQACIEQKVKADLFNAAIGPVAVWLGLGKDASCAHSSSFTSSVDTQISNVFWPVKTTEQQLLSAVDPANTSVIVADYPRLFPSSSSAQGCTQLSLLFTKDDMNWMDSEGDRLDGVLQEAAGEAGVSFVDVRSIFSGHEVCGPAGAWINGISMASGNGGSCTFSIAGQCIIPGLPIVGSFHPNASGHANGYAAAISNYIQSAADQTGAGFPANPPPLPDPPSSPTPTAVGVGELDAQPVTAVDPTCDGSYQAGQEMQFSGGGFTPGASVQLYVTGANGEVLVTRVTANATGLVSGQARIPLGATSFTETGAAAGEVFLDAIGTGSVAAHLDDVAMVGLAAHTSGCGSVEPLTFYWILPLLANFNKVTPAKAGLPAPVSFYIPGAGASLADVLAPGYPQSAPVSCTAPASLTSGDPAEFDGSLPKGDLFGTLWKTDKSWRGCRELIVKLVDGSYHSAVFDFVR